MEIALGIWLVCGLGAAAVASSKGRSGCGWLILGFLLGPLGLVIAAGMSNLSQAAQIAALTAAQHQAQGQSPASTRACPQCAEQIQHAAIKCRFCGSEVAPELSPAQIAEMMKRNNDAYSAGTGNSTQFSGWWLVGIGVVVVLAAQSCNP